jgi:glycosyltransferase involved in cell wall biosynthesis
VNRPVQTGTRPAPLADALAGGVLVATPREPRIAVVIPCYRVRKHVLDVLAAIGPEVQHVYVVDDCCPEQSGRLVEEQCHDPRVRVIRHDRNLGVGGAVVTGYRAALADGVDVVTKIDGDGQMDPALIPEFVAPILAGEADYTKGNRFYTLHGVKAMPSVRLFGNAALSFLTKISSGYWTVFDPTNGYTAVHTAALRTFELGTLSERYFFESDMLIKLGAARAVVLDVPMESRYADEVSGLSVRRILGQFLWRHLYSTVRRVVYTYFVRDFNFASLNLLVGVPLLLFGLVFGALTWAGSLRTGMPATTGTVMLSVLPIVLGVQLCLFFVSYDVANEPRRPLQRWARLKERALEMARATRH